jgi:transposase
MEELRARVAGGESAAGAARGLGISLVQARRLGFRVERAGAARAQGAGSGRRAEVVDWLAWIDPDSGTGLRQREVARLAGVAQQTVSRVALALREMEEDKDE